MTDNFFSFILCLEQKVEIFSFVTFSGIIPVNRQNSQGENLAKLITRYSYCSISHRFQNRLTKMGTNNRYTSASKYYYKV